MRRQEPQRGDRGHAPTALFALGDTDDLGAALKTAAALVDLRAASRSAREVIELAARTLPDLVFVGDDLDDMDLEATVAGVRAAAPEAQVVVLASGFRLERLRYLVSQGVADVLARPLQSEALHTLVRLVRPPPLATPAAQVSAPAAPKVLGQPSACSKVPRQPPSRPPGAGIWCFTGPGTGDGRTTALLSIASKLAESSPRVVVVDANLDYGDVALYLSQPPSVCGLLELLDTPGYLQRRVLSPYLHRHPAGFQVLAPPVEHAPAALGLLERLPKLVRRLGLMADYVLVVLPAGAPQVFRQLLQEATRVVSVSASNLERIKNHEHHLASLESWGVSPANLKPLVVGCTPGAQAQVERRPGLHGVSFLPYTPDLRAQAIRRGLPMSAVGPSEYREAVAALLQPFFRQRPRTPHAWPNLEVAA